MPLPTPGAARVGGAACGGEAAVVGAASGRTTGAAFGISPPVPGAVMTSVNIVVRPMYVAVIVTMPGESVVTLPVLSTAAFSGHSMSTSRRW